MSYSNLSKREKIEVLIEYNMELAESMNPRDYDEWFKSLLEFYLNNQPIDTINSEFDEVMQIMEE
jgi:hypothetical protein